MASANDVVGLQAAACFLKLIFERLGEPTADRLLTAVIDRKKSVRDLENFLRAQSDGSKKAGRTRYSVRHDFALESRAIGQLKTYPDGRLDLAARRRRIAPGSARRQAQDRHRRVRCQNWRPPRNSNAREKASIRGDREAGRRRPARRTSGCEAFIQLPARLLFSRNSSKSSEVGSPHVSSASHRKKLVCASLLAFLRRQRQVLRACHRLVVTLDQLGLVVDLQFAEIRAGFLDLRRQIFVANLFLLALRGFLAGAAASVPLPVGQRSRASAPGNTRPRCRPGPHSSS